MAHAHTPNAGGHWHDLAAHLLAVAETARGFAAPFGAGDVAYLAGLWHDVGKFTHEFQSYLAAQQAGLPHPRSPHAIWGAALAYHILWSQSHRAEIWKEIALPIAGHHAGLADGGTIAQGLEAFIAGHREELRALVPELRGLPAPPPLPPPPPAPLRREFRLRMIASALVDADYLDTERHFDASRATTRRNPPTLPALVARFDRAQAAWVGTHDPARTVNRIRREIYDACLRAAPGPRGVYRLTVPTGGGKTRSGLAFALRHAAAHGLERVVVAIPYTSIIDQTAQVYRDMLGDEAVVEHHSQFVPADSGRQDPAALRARLATENWDAPLIVTTTVQLFESLLGRRPGQLRKLHNLARSVVVLDEVQSLPTEVLAPTADVLRTLVEEYGSTVVLSTATQPALEEARELAPFRGLPVAEIVPGYEAHFRALRRVEYERAERPLEWDEVAGEVLREGQVLVIVNRRRDALALVDALGARGAGDLFHLSTLLCGAHRRRVLGEIRARLARGEPVRLISTQVVEAGVDLDFPVVWRALGPLDRIVQAAGRCNREGKLDRGRVVIFEPANGGAPRGPYAAAMIEARHLLERDGTRRLHDPDFHREYFARLYGAVPLDRRGVQALRAGLRYPEVAERYRLIPDDTIPVVVDYESGARRLADWVRAPGRAAWRRLQPYLVSVFAHELRRHEGGLLEPVGDSGELYRAVGGYDERLGLAAVLADPADLIESDR